MTAQNIYSFFHQSLQTFPERCALYARGSTISYRELETLINRMVPALAADSRDFIGVFAYKSSAAYSGVLAALKAGKGYMPLNPKFPAARNEQLSVTAGIRTIIADHYHLGALARFLEKSSRSLTVCLPEYLVPKSVIRLQDFPLNINRKTDHLKLMKLYENDKRQQRKIQKS